MAVMTAIGAAATVVGSIFSIGSSIYNLFQQSDAKRRAEEARERQEVYNTRLSEDIGRQGEAKIAHLRVAGERSLGDLGYSMSRSGVASAGTAKQIYEESELNIERDVDTLEADIAMAIETARITGQNQIDNINSAVQRAEANQITAFGSAVNSGFNLLQTGETLYNDVKESGGFTSWWEKQWN